MKVLVLGGTGLLGSTLVPSLARAGHEVSVHSCHHEGMKADLTDREQTFALLKRAEADCIINLVCLSDVDACERQVSQAYKLNVLSLENVCAWLVLNRGAKLIHISTDHLYDKEGANQEDQVSIKNNYALSKYCAEKVALAHGACVLRTNFFGPSQCERRQSFSDWVLDNLKRENKVTFFDDVLFSPLTMNTVSEAIKKVLENFSEGVFNLGSRQGFSKSDFSFMLAECLNLSTKNASRASIDTLGLSDRPRRMMMDSRKFEAVFAYSLPSLAEEIEDCCRQYQEGSA